MNKYKQVAVKKIVVSSLIDRSLAGLLTYEQCDRIIELFAKNKYLFSRFFKERGVKISLQDADKTWRMNRKHWNDREKARSCSSFGLLSNEIENVAENTSEGLEFEGVEWGKWSKENEIEVPVMVAGNVYRARVVYKDGVVRSVKHDLTVSVSFAWRKDIAKKEVLRALKEATGKDMIMRNGIYF